MNIKTSDLTGNALNWAVAKCESLDCYIEDGVVHLKGQPFDTDWRYWLPSTDWAQGGPIIEREHLQASYQRSGKFAGQWGCIQWFTNRQGALVAIDQYGPTPLIAAMRCFVASKLGDEVEIPEELK